MELPKNDNLPVEKLGSVFNNTVATYKFYWFLSLLDCVVKHQKSRMDIWEVVARMVSLAWYPIHYYHLSFGKSDSLDGVIRSVRENTNMPIDLPTEDIVRRLMDKADQKDMRKMLRVLTLNVPYRFLNPWLNTSDNRLIVERSQTFENECLYALWQEEGTMIVEINPHWVDYLMKNYAMLHDFGYWNLTLFLQARNLNVPNIPSKLIKPTQRESLAKQHNYWDRVIERQGGVRCLFTDKLLQPKEYDLDHFIPWSFVAHNQIWNLVPVDGSINSSKSDKLPDLDKYLFGLAKQQQKAVAIAYEMNPNDRILEDYLNVADSVEGLIGMEDERLLEVFDHAFRPMVQIARNMNFEMWEH